MPALSVSKFALALAALALAACTTAAPAGDGDQAIEAAYQQCLKDNMAVAMAWTAIEAMCRSNIGAPEPEIDAANDDFFKQRPVDK